MTYIYAFECYMQNIILGKRNAMWGIPNNSGQIIEGIN